MMKQKFALVISRLFHPLVVLSFLTLDVAFHSGMAPTELIRFLLVFVAGMLLPPVLFLDWAVKMGRVSNWDVSNRRQRVRVFLLFGILLLVDYLLIKSFGNAALEMLFVLFIFWFLGFFAITVFWKISGHLAGLTLVLGFLIEWYGAMMAPLVFLIPLVGWARVVSKNHTVAQVVAGVLYSFIFLYETRQSFF